MFKKVTFGTQPRQTTRAEFKNIRKKLFFYSEHTRKKKKRKEFTRIKVLCVPNDGQ